MRVEINKISCEDCFTYLAKLDDNSIDLAILDPPYYIENMKKKLADQSIRRSSRNSVFHAEWDFKFETLDNYKEWTRLLLIELQRVLKPKAQTYLFMSYHHLDWMITMVKEVGFRFYKPLIWYKPDVMGLFPNQYGCNYEPFLWFSKRGKEGKHKNHIGCAQRDVMMFYSTNIKYRKEADFHPTPKPVQLIRQLIKNSSDEGDVVLDCFMGSGTTAVASKNTGRQFLGCELNPEYVATCEKRLTQKNLNTLLEVEQDEHTE